MSFEIYFRKPCGGSKRIGAFGMSRFECSIRFVRWRPRINRVFPRPGAAGTGWNWYNALMLPTPSLHLAILQRLEQLEAELRLVRSDLKKLRTHDPATAAIVTRGAQLSRERAMLERRMELLRVDLA